jgi:hypothetical protein
MVPSPAHSIDRYSGATNLAETRLTAGDPRWPRPPWQKTLAILDDLKHPDADRIRARLNEAAGI